MKTVYLVCATGIATSTMLRVKIDDFLKEHGVEAAVQQYRVSELSAARLDADVIVATTAIPPEFHEKVPVVSGIPLITGQGQAETLQRVLSILQSKTA